MSAAQPWLVVPAIPLRRAVLAACVAALALLSLSGAPPVLQDLSRRHNGDIAAVFRGQVARSRNQTRHVFEGEEELGEEEVEANATRSQSQSRHVFEGEEVAAEATHKTWHVFEGEEELGEDEVEANATRSQSQSRHVFEGEELGKVEVEAETARSRNKTRHVFEGEDKKGAVVPPSSPNSASLDEQRATAAGTGAADTGLLARPSAASPGPRRRALLSPAPRRAATTAPRRNVTLRDDAPLDDDDDADFSAFDAADRVMNATASASPAPERCPAARRYVHLLTTREGMSAWTHVLLEALTLARHTGRTLVEPCVSGGMIVPCNVGRVLALRRDAVPHGRASAGNSSALYAEVLDGRVDPLAVKAFADECMGDTDSLPPWIQERRGRSYPLSLYMDLRALDARGASSFVPFAQWLSCEKLRVKKKPDAGLRLSSVSIFARTAYCVGKASDVAEDPRVMAACQADGRRDQRSYVFERVLLPPAAAPAPLRSREAHLWSRQRGVIEGDAERNMFLLNVWRGFWRPFGTFHRTPKFNSLHTAAVEGWLHRRLRVPLQPVRTAANGSSLPQRSSLRYVAFGWRSETVPQDELPGCAASLARTTVPIVEAAHREGAPGAVLVSDLPALSNPCRSWHVYNGTSDKATMRVALARLTDVGLLKYDADYGAIDAGVLAIRDWLLAVRAKRYVTCHEGLPGSGGASRRCRKCFRYNSKYVAQILAAREKSSLESWHDWFSVTTADLRLSRGFFGLGNRSDAAAATTATAAAAASGAGSAALPGSELQAAPVGRYVPPPSIL
jgi:hypothetical protein